MTNVDIALLTGHDFRNDNIGLMRLIGDNDKATPHPQLLKLFEHYKYLITSENGIRDSIGHKAAMAWVYSTFFELYGEKILYRKPVHVHLSTNEPFYKKYLLEVDPLLISLSFNSVVYLWFCTEEYDLVKRIIKRLKHLSLVWKGFVGEPIGYKIRVCTPYGDKFIESYWSKYMPSLEIINSKDINLKIYRLLPLGFKKCIKDIFTAFTLFKRDHFDYGSNAIPNNLDWSVFAKIHLNSDTSIKGLIETLNKINSTLDDPGFVFDGLRWLCTHQEFEYLIRASPGCYTNQNFWLLLCYLSWTGQLIIDHRDTVGKYKWGVSDFNLGTAMFDHFAYKNPQSIMKYLDIIQYKQNRKFDKPVKEALIQLMRQYRELHLALDPKKLGIKRGVLINLLSAGYGDIFCVS